MFSAPPPGRVSLKLETCKVAMLFDPLKWVWVSEEGFRNRKANLVGAVDSIWHCALASERGEVVPPPLASCGFIVTRYCVFVCAFVLINSVTSFNWRQGLCYIIALDPVKLLTSSSQCLFNPLKIFLLSFILRRSQSSRALVFNLFCSRTPRYNLSWTLYPQSCWCIIQVIHT
jgi:hypothetical protein